ARHFGGVRAVDGISFRVNEGELVSLIGPNGSGKTTAFNLISGLLRPNGGRIDFVGHRIDGLSPDQIAELGLARTFQNGRVFGNMTVRDNVLLGMHTRLLAARPLASIRHVPVVNWLALLAETVNAIARPPAVRAEEAASRAEVPRELGRFGQRLLPRETHPADALSYANHRPTEHPR